MKSRVTARRRPLSVASAKDAMKRLTVGWPAWFGGKAVPNP